MRHTSRWRAILLGLSLLLVAASETRSARGQLIGEATGVIHVKSSLVSLDVNVFDQEGKAVTTGLTKEDFSITEAGVPRQITSFETPDQHLAPLQGGTSLNIIVLDLLNSSFQDFSWIREQVRTSLESEGSPLRGGRAVLLAADNAEISS